MESCVIGSFHKPSPRLSFPFGAGLCSYPLGYGVAGHVLKCKASSNVERLYAAPIRLQLQKPNLVSQHSRRIGQRSITLNPRRNLAGILKSASTHSFDSDNSKSPWSSAQDALDAFYRFSRPHTIIGTALSIISVSLLAVEKLSDFSPLFFTRVLEAIVAALLMNVYIVGLNQLTDIEIDKVNKPYLPLASGEFSFRTGVMIVTSFAISVGSWPLFCALFVSFILGTAYSINVPFFRWKRFAVLAAMCIFAVRALIVQIAFYLHVQDIPDIVGDRIYGIRSFTVRLGQERVFWICIALLEMAYAVALFIGATSPSMWSKWITVTGHALLGLLLWNRAKSIDLKSKAAITSFYMFIWKLFYAEYLLIPLIR
ncbi:homogentisate phytyltransferase [Striga asiatica]|uniref:Homogentisate phytyltransferase n=1 Tax=Striga asiatica TaxID=4170 RepID=A0A5A7PIC5_STRAF|nr:homogentisate phytyltransferase [Striga asiatica]